MTRASWALTLALVGVTGCGNGAKSAQASCAAANGGCDPLTTCAETAAGPTCGPCPANYAGTGTSGCVDPLACAGAYFLQLTQATAPLVQNMPASCGGTVPVCCPGGSPVIPCGPLQADFRAQVGDTPRLETVLGPDRLDVVLRPRLLSLSAIPVTLPVAGACTFAVDTAPGATPDVELHLAIDRVTDATGPHLVAGTMTVVGLTADDISLAGGVGCALTSIGTGFFAGTLANALYDSLRLPLCTACPCAP